MMITMMSSGWRRCHGEGRYRWTWAQLVERQGRYGGQAALADDAGAGGSLGGLGQANDFQARGAPEGAQI